MKRLLIVAAGSAAVLALGGTLSANAGTGHPGSPRPCSTTTTEPTGEPTTTPPITEPTTEPTEEPTTPPTTEPTEGPTTEPTEDPTTTPTEEPLLSAALFVDGGHRPRPCPTVSPTISPTGPCKVVQDLRHHDPRPCMTETTEPTEDPSTTVPTTAPTTVPTGEPTTTPTEATTTIAVTPVGNDSGGLPLTGTAASTVAALGVLLLLIGAATIVLTRKRRDRFGA